MIWVEVDNVDDSDYQEIQRRLNGNLASETRHFEAISDAFVFAIKRCPQANPSDLWQHIVYRTYLQTRRSEQSWKRASGQAFEQAFATLYNPRLDEFSIKLVVLSPNQVRFALAEMGITGLVGRPKEDNQAGKRVDPALLPIKISPLCKRALRH